MLGVALYIGEGGKTNGNVRVINSDPCVINLAVRWFKEVFDLKIKHFTLNIHLYPDNDIEESLQYWSNITGIPRDQFGKTQVDRRKKKTKKRGMLKHGTAHLYVHARGDKRFGRNLFREINAMIDEIYRQFT